MQVVRQSISLKHVQSCTSCPGCRSPPQPSEEPSVLLEINFVGPFVSGEEASINPAKVNTVWEGWTSSNLSELCSFLALTSYIQRFIKNYATIARFLHQLSQKAWFTFRLRTVLLTFQGLASWMELRCWLTQTLRRPSIWQTDLLCCQVQLLHFRDIAKVKH